MFFSASENFFWEGKKVKFFKNKTIFVQTRVTGEGGLVKKKKGELMRFSDILIELLIKDNLEVTKSVPVRKLNRGYTGILEITT